MLSWVKHWLDGRAQRAVDNAVKHIWWLVTSGAPRARYWDHFYLASLLKILMRGLSAPSVNLQMTPSWEGVLICLRGETHFRGTWIDWINRPGQTVWVSIGPSVGSRQSYRVGEERLESCLMERDGTVLMDMRQQCAQLGKKADEKVRAPGHLPHRRCYSHRAGSPGPI